jgi:hypothetical protein
MSNKITATITKTQSNVRIAKATNAKGVPVALASVENILVITNPQINPAMTLEEAHQSGNAITGAVINTARLDNVSRIWVVASDSYDGPDVRTIRIIEEKVPQFSTHNRLGVKADTSQYLN